MRSTSRLEKLTDFRNVPRLPGRCGMSEFSRFRFGGTEIEDDLERVGGEGLCDSDSALSILFRDGLHGDRAPFP